MKILVSGRARSEVKPNIIRHSEKRVIKEKEVYDEMLIAMRMTMIIAVIIMHGDDHDEENAGTLYDESL
jgi:hypothetical protein